MNRLQTGASTQTKQKDSIYTNVYSGLWILALVSASISYLNLPTTELHGIGGLFSLVFVIATAYQQRAVYRDLHIIEKEPDWAKKEYGSWVDSSFERFFRYGIIISLLFGVGKIAAVIYPILEFADIYLDKFLKQIELDGQQILQSLFGGIFDPDRLFIIGSLCTFLFLLVWNIRVCPT